MNFSCILKKLPFMNKLFTVIAFAITVIWGTSRAVPGDVVITEVFTRSNGNIPDYIELFNFSGNIQDLSGWKISIYNTEYELEVPDYIEPGDSWLDVYSLSPNSFMFITGFDGYFSGEDSTVYRVNGDLRLIEESEEYNADYDNFVNNAPHVETINNGVWAPFSLSHAASEIELKDEEGTVIDAIYYENDADNNGSWESETNYSVGTYNNADFFGHSMELENDVLDNVQELEQIISDWTSSVHSTSFMFTSSALYNIEEFFMEFGSPGKRNFLDSKISLFNMQCGPIPGGNSFCSEVGSECAVGIHDTTNFDLYIDIGPVNCGAGDGNWTDLPEGDPLEIYDVDGICVYTCDWDTTALTESEMNVSLYPFSIYHDQVPGGSKTLLFDASQSYGQATINEQLWLQNGTVIQLGESMESSFSQGIHELVLLVKDSQDLWAVDSFNFEIIEPNQAPQSIIDAQQEFIEMPHNGDPLPSITSISIFGNQSCDCDDYIYNRWQDNYIVMDPAYNCDCEDTFFNTVSNSEIDIYYWTINGDNISTNQDLYSYVDSLGEFSYSLIITDNYGYSGDASITLTVEPEPNLPPVANIQGNPYVEFQLHDGIPFNTETLYLTVDYPFPLPAIYNFSEDQMLVEGQQENDLIYSTWNFVDGNNCIPQSDYCIDNNNICDGCSSVELPIGTYTFILEVVDSYNCAYPYPDPEYCPYYDSGPEYFTDENENGLWDAGEDFTDFNGNAIWDELTPYSSDTDTITVIFSEPNDPPTVFAAPQAGLTFLESTINTIYAEVYDPEFFVLSDQQDGFCYPNYEAGDNNSESPCFVQEGENFLDAADKCCLHVEWDILWKCDGSCDPTEIPGGDNFTTGIIPSGADPFCLTDQCDEQWLINPTEIQLQVNVQENPNFEPDTLYIELRATDPFYNAGYASDDFISRDTAVVYIINANQPPVYGPTDEFEWLLNFPDNGFDISEDEIGIYVDGIIESDSTINLYKYFKDPDNEPLEFGFNIQSNEWLEEIYSYCISDNDTIWYPDECNTSDIRILEDSLIVIKNLVDQNGDAQVFIYASDSETTISADFWVHIAPTNDTPIAYDALVVLNEFYENADINEPAWYNMDGNAGASNESFDLTFEIEYTTLHGIALEYTENDIINPWDGTYEPFSEFFGFDTLKFRAYDQSDSSEIANFVFEVIKSNNAQPVIQLYTMDVYEDEILEFNVNPNDSLQAEDFSDSNGNGTWDDGEEFTDENDNGQWDPGHPLSGYKYVGLDVLDLDNDCVSPVLPADCNNPSYTLDNLSIHLYEGLDDNWNTQDTSVNAQGLNYVHINENFSGDTIYIQLYVNDNEPPTLLPGPPTSESKTVAIYVIPVNDAPTADDITYDILEDDTFDFMLDGFDEENDDLRYIILDTLINEEPQPQHGMLITDNIPEIKYIPDADFNGEDFFYYYIGDDGITENNPDSLFSNPIKVTLNIQQVNDPPRVDTSYFVIDTLTQVLEDSENIDFYLVWTDIDLDPELNVNPANFDDITWNFNSTLTEEGLKFWINETFNPVDTTYTSPRRFRGKFTIDSLLAHWNGTDSSTILISDSNQSGDFPYQYILTAAEVNDPPTIDTVRVDTSLLNNGVDYIVDEESDINIPISIAEDSHDVPLFIHFYDIDSDPFLNVDPKPLLDYSWEFQALNNRFTVLYDFVYDSLLEDTVDFFWIDTILSDWNGIEYLETIITDSDGDSFTDTIPFHIFQVNDTPEPFEFYPLLYQYPLYPDTNAFYIENDSWTFRLPESDVSLNEENPVKLLIKWQRTNDKDLDSFLSQDSTTSRINFLYYRLELTTDDTSDYTIVLKSHIEDSDFDEQFSCESDLTLSEELCETYGLVDSLAFLKLDLTDEFFGYRKSFYDTLDQVIDTVRNIQVDLSGNTIYNFQVIAYNSERDEESDTSEVEELAGYDAYGIDLSRKGNPNQSHSTKFKADLVLPDFQFNVIRSDIFWEYYDLYIIQSEPILEFIDGTQYSPLLELEYESGGRDTITRTSSEHGPIYYTSTFKDTGDITFNYSARDSVENYGISQKTIHYKIVDPLARTVAVTPSGNSSIIFSPGDVPEMTSVIAMDFEDDTPGGRVSDEHLISAVFIPENLPLSNSVELRFNLENVNTEEMNYWNYLLMQKAGHDWIELENRFTLDNGILYTEIDQLGAYSVVFNPELEQPLPDHFILHQNYPNPFNGTTIIKYELPEDAQIKVEIVDILGTRVRVLHDKAESGGYHTLTWDGTNSNGLKSASGVYFINLKIDHKENYIQKIMYLK